MYICCTVCHRIVTMPLCLILVEKLFLTVIYMCVLPDDVDMGHIHT